MSDLVPKSILIVGGGTAGWMSASMLKTQWPDCAVTLVESDQVAPIGVGEGSTPYLKQFFKKLGIADRDWMPHCNATYKSGIRFPGWSSVPGYESYFHPFYSALDIKTGDTFFQRCNDKRAGGHNWVHPDDYFLASKISSLGYAPIPEKTLPFEVDYGYHFDATLLAKYLKNYSVDKGVTHIVDYVSSVAVDHEKNVSHVLTQQHGELVADLYVDCSGFAGIIARQALNAEYVSYSNRLLNDSAVTIATPVDFNKPLMSETTSSALKNGWAWSIPLTGRYGNGYVYSSAYLTAEEAEQELLEHLHLDKEAYSGKARHLKMRIGRLEQHWNGNCLAVGLAQGFLEPLEATGLMLTQFTLEKFIQSAQQNSKKDKSLQQRYNLSINQFIAGIADYIMAHYRLNSRKDSPYWQAAREAARTSNTLEYLLDHWQQGGDFDSALNACQGELAYLRPSWYVILSGMGAFPKNSQPDYDIALDGHRLRARELCESSVKGVFSDHASLLQNYQRSLNV